MLELCVRREFGKHLLFKLGPRTTGNNRNLQDTKQ